MAKKWATSEAKNSPWYVWYLAKMYTRTKFSSYINRVLRIRLYKIKRFVTTSPWILGEVLEKSLNSVFLENSFNLCGRPWKVLKFSSTLNVVAWKAFLLYAIINYQLKTSVLKNVGKLVEQTSQAYKVLLYNLITFLVSGHWNLNVVLCEDLQKSLKKVCMNPVPSMKLHNTFYIYYTN